jgi:hypothetical protein
MSIDRARLRPLPLLVACVAWAVVVYVVYLVSYVR